MTQFATVNRFCSIEGTECKKQIPYGGRDTFFFAYPSEPRWQSFSSELAKEMRDRGFDGTRWEDQPRQSVVHSSRVGRG